MEVSHEISDEAFIPFLQSLGVETYKKSFEWMLNDKDFAGILMWLYQNLDHNNALSDREEYRYAELKKQGQLLSVEALESCLAGFQKEYEGLCLPGNKEVIDEVQCDIKMLNERLHMLEEQESTFKDLLNQNELVKEELNQEVIKLHSAEQQCVEDESTAAEDCTRLALEVENITEDVITVVADTLALYSNCNGDKEISRKFFTFGPFDSYKQTQALFRSHFDLYTSKKFSGRQKNDVSDNDLRAAFVEAKSMEDRLSDAMLLYIKSKAELLGEQAKLALVYNYSNVHPSQIITCSMETQSAVELLEQEEYILLQQVEHGVRDAVLARTTLFVETTARAALAVREQLHSDITHLQDATQRALALDKMLYFALRHELRTLEELFQFAAHLKQYVMSESEAVISRIESMNRIASEVCDDNLKSDDPLTSFLRNALSLSHDSDVSAPVKAFNELENSIKELRGDVIDALNKKEAALKEIGIAARPIRELLFDGCTKQPRCRDAGVASLAHNLKQDMEETEKRIHTVSSLYTTVKNGDKHHLRKLWQWFITDWAKFAIAVKGVQGKTLL